MDSTAAFSRARFAERIVENVETVIVGKRRQIEYLLRATRRHPEIALLALPHRLIITPQSQLRGRQAISLVTEILDGIELDLSEAG